MSEALRHGRLIGHLEDHADPGRISRPEHGADVHDALPQGEVTVDEVMGSMVIVQVDVPQAVGSAEEVLQAASESRMAGVEREP